LRTFQPFNWIGPTGAFGPKPSFADHPGTELQHPQIRHSPIMQQ